MTDQPQPPEQDPAAQQPPSEPGYGQPGYGQPPYGDPGVPPASDNTNGLAIASLVSSLVGLLCCIGGIVGIVLGIVALGQIKQRNEGGRGLAIGGIAAGVVSILLALTVGILREA